MKKRDTIRSIIVRSLRRNIRLTLLLVLLIIASIILELLPPIFLGRAVDQMSKGIATQMALVVLYFASVAAGKI